MQSWRLRRRGLPTEDDALVGGGCTRQGGCWWEIEHGQVLALECREAIKEGMAPGKEVLRPAGSGHAGLGSSDGEGPTVEASS